MTDILRIKIILFKILHELEVKDRGRFSEIIDLLAELGKEKAFNEGFKEGTLAHTFSQEN